MFTFNFNELMWVLSSAIDLVGITDTNHGKRVAFYASEINARLGLDWSQDDLVIACLLHDCGVSSTDVHENLVREMVWDQAGAHCQRGAELLAEQDLLRHLAPVIAHHHTSWEQLGGLELPERIKELANLIFLADRLDVLVATSPGEILGANRRIIERLADLSPQLFDPRMIRALKKAAHSDAFWLVRTIDGLSLHFRSWLDSQQSRLFEYEEVIPLFGLFASCVDGKSPYTAYHSKGVRDLSLYLGHLSGLPKETLHRMAIAGLLHDLGKLRVPDHILEKPGPLDELEFSSMRHHSFDTWDILGRIPGFEAIATWASCHHEKLDGSGYPFRLTGEQISIESRIITVADIIQALVHKRPYRQEPLPPSRIQEILKDMVDTGKTDPTITGLALADFDECCRYAESGKGDAIAFL